MSTSAEQITTMVASNTALQAFFEGERQRLIDARNDLPGKIETTLYVDEQNGLPGGAGTEADPLDSVDGALQLVHSGQVAIIKLLSDCTINKVRTFNKTSIDFDSGNGVQHTLTFADQASNWVDRSASFRGVDLMLKFSNIAVALPAGVNINPINDAAGLCGASIFNASIDGGTSLSPLVGTLGVPILSLRNAVVANMAGRWVSGYAAAAALTSDLVGGIIDPAIAN